jgi:hypothetical protein
MKLNLFFSVDRDGERSRSVYEEERLWERGSDKGVKELASERARDRRKERE